MKPAEEAPLWPLRAGGAVDVLGIGQNSLDRIGVVDGLPPLGGKTPLEGYRKLPGGQIATAVLATARLGLRAAYVGSVGSDAAGKDVLAPLEEAGIDVRGVKRVEGARTQLALILVDRASGERTVFWNRDPALALAPVDLRRDRVESARVLLLDAGDPEAALWAADVARAAGIPVVLDADTPGPGVDALLERVDFPIVSRALAEAFSVADSAREALSELVARGAHWAVVTLGAQGAIAASRERRVESPGFGVRARDTTGAGDAFHGAFVWALLEGRGIEGALRVANAAAALNCRAVGAQGGLPDRAALERFLRAAPAPVGAGAG